MRINIDGTKFTHRDNSIKIVASYKDSDRETKKVEKKQYTNKGNINLQKTATLDISKSGYASLAYDSKPGVVSGKTTKEVYEKIGIISEYDTMRIIDPEAYKTHRSMINEAFAYSKSGNECLSNKALKAATSFLLNWDIEQMTTHKYDIRSVAYSAIKDMQNRYGDDTEINVSSPDENDARGDIWRFRGDYNILLTPEQMQSWINDDPEEENLKALLKSLDESMKELREEREKQEDDIEGLMLGLSINDDNSPVFYATFKGNTAGDITATTAQELFAKLNTSD